VRNLEPLPSQTLNEDEQERLANLGKNGRGTSKGIR
jgi:hypothetical protein